MIRLIFSLALLLTSAITHAGPGAHGPNGEHLDAPGATQAGAASAWPRFEAATETFELVGHLYADELSVLIDRFDTNAPVRDATVEVEYQGIKETAKFHADHGDYSFTDEHLLAALAKPGQHALVFTILAGQESDLVDGTLAVAAHEDAHDHAHWNVWYGIAGMGLLAALLTGAAWAQLRKAKAQP